MSDEVRETVNENQKLLTKIKKKNRSRNPLQK